VNRWVVDTWGVHLQQAEQKNNRHSELKEKMRGCRSSNNASLIVESVRVGGASCGDGVR
jgi:hypothetical protein